MKIRTLQPSDMEAASAVCLAAFHHSVASSLPDEGIATFHNIAMPESFRERMAKDTVMLVAEVENKVVGVAELRDGCHVSMLFVSPDQQKQGIGKALFSGLLQQARSNKITVSASLSSVPAYQKYGFGISGNVGQIAGLIFQPMEMTIL
ncbi:GNAT family N-acetyltransferase [Marinomonas fungiae]|uniref:GNAT family N-acetyltransferase n=1 Tax=Marinomonas fungiae TaxID=1137284 RepID=UPI003A9289C5